MGGAGDGSPPPERRSRRPPLSKLQSVFCLPGKWEIRHRPIKGDIWLNFGHHLHLTNKGDPGTPGIIIVTSDCSDRYHCAWFTCMVRSGVVLSASLAPEGVWRLHDLHRLRGSAAPCAATPRGTFFKNKISDLGQALLGQMIKNTAQENILINVPRGRKRDKMLQLGNRGAAARASGARSGVPALGGGLLPPEPPPRFFFFLKI